MKNASRQSTRSLDRASNPFPEVQERIFAFVAVTADSDGTTPVEAIFEGFPSILLLHPNNPRFREIRGTLAGLVFDQAVKLSFATGRQEIISVEPTDRQPECRAMRVIEWGEDGVERLLIPGIRLPIEVCPVSRKDCTN